MYGTQLPRAMADTPPPPPPPPRKRFRRSMCLLRHTEKPHGTHAIANPRISAYTRKSHYYSNRLPRLAQSSGHACSVMFKHIFICLLSLTSCPILQSDAGESTPYHRVCSSDTVPSVQALGWIGGEIASCQKLPLAPSSRPLGSMSANLWPQRACRPLACPAARCWLL